MKFPALLLICCAAKAQEINIYSEFLRFNPWGEVVTQDREIRPREVLSPAVPRNGHLTVQVVVTAPPGTNYFLYTAQSPADTLQIKIYREHFVRCGEDYCPDWLAEQRSPSFGAIPESIYRLPGQNTRCYLLDIWVPPDVPPRRVRVETLLKVGYWLVAPMEVRVIAPLVPDSGRITRREDRAEVEARSSDTAQRQLLRYVNGLPPEVPPGILRLRDVLQRNAAEDMLLAAQLGFRNPQLNLLAWTPFVFPQTGAEWYLRVRDLIYRYTH
jgi:hypothetical protein